MAIAGALFLFFVDLILKFPNSPPKKLTNEDWLILHYSINLLMKNRHHEFGTCIETRVTYNLQ